MDLYITDSLQDMLDMDIKNEMATDLSSMTDYVRTLTTPVGFRTPMNTLDLSLGPSHPCYASRLYFQLNRRVGEVFNNVNRFLCRIPLD